MYHGTDAQYHEELEFNELLSQRPFATLDRMCAQNQMCPRRLGVVYTAFSPLRCYVWALFKAEIIQSIPAQSRLEYANQRWSSNGVEYRGLVLLQFTSAQPQPASLTSYVIPPGRESAWFELTKELDRRGVSSDFTSYSSFTNDTAQTMIPDMIHGLEILGARQQLSAYTKNHWRTVWTSDRARDILNANNLEVFAIAINVLNTEEPKSAKGAIGKSKRDESPEGGKKGTVRRAIKKLGHKISTMSFKPGSAAGEV